MSSQPHPNQMAESSDPDPRLTPYLFDLLEVGAKVAQTIGRQAGEPTPPPNAAEQFECVSRAMRRTILLIRHIATNSPAKNRTQARTQARKSIIRAVEDVIQRKRDPNEAEPLQAEFRERLDAPDLDEEIDTRPVAEIITDITRDLGLAHFPGTHPWTRRTPRDLKALNARAAQPPQTLYHPGPHGPEPGAPQPKHPPKPPDPKGRAQELVELAKMLNANVPPP